MPKPLSKEMREKIIHHKKNGAKNEEIVKWLLVSKASVKRIWKIYKEEKTVEAKGYKRGRRAAFCEAKMNKIGDKIREVPDITLDELIKEFHLNISISALSRRLIKKDLTFKKRHYFQKSSFDRMSNGFGVSG